MIITKDNIKKHEKYDKYNPKAIVIMIDEMSEVMSGNNYKLVSSIQEDIGSIARLGRAAACHLVLATQRPSSNVINADLKNNIQQSVILGDFDSGASTLVFDEDVSSMSKPEIKGRGFIKNGKTIQEFQSYWTEPEKDFDRNQVIPMECSFGKHGNKDDNDEKEKNNFNEHDLCSNMDLDLSIPSKRRRRRSEDDAEKGDFISKRDEIPRKIEKNPFDLDIDLPKRSEKPKENYTISENDNHNYNLNNTLEETKKEETLNALLNDTTNNISSDIQDIRKNDPTTNGLKLKLNNSAQDNQNRSHQLKLKKANINLNQNNMNNQNNIDYMIASDNNMIVGVTENYNKETKNEKIDDIIFN